MDMLLITMFLIGILHGLMSMRTTVLAVESNSLERIARETSIFKSLLDCMAALAVMVLVAWAFAHIGILTTVALSISTYLFIKWLINDINWIKFYPIKPIFSITAVVIPVVLILFL